MSYTQRLPVLSVQRSTGDLAGRAALAQRSALENQRGMSRIATATPPHAHEQPYWPATVTRRLYGQGPTHRCGGLGLECTGAGYRNGQWLFAACLSPHLFWHAQPLRSLSDCLFCWHLLQSHQTAHSHGKAYVNHHSIPLALNIDARFPGMHPNGRGW